MGSVTLLFALCCAGPHLALAQEATSSDTSPIQDDDEDSPAWVTLLQYLLIVVLVVASGLFSGLTLGLLGLDKIGLEIIGNGDEPRMAAFAKRIQPVRADGNLLLCTLLLGNVAVNALLSIVMAQLTSGLVGFALATVIITIFGEIVPQAVCSRHALRIGSAVVPLVKIIIVILYPVTKPLSIMLDKLLGNEIGTIHSRTELGELLKIHVQHGALDVETGREVAGAMTYKELTVRDVMTPAKECFMLSVSEKLNFKTLSVIFKSGFSRIPVFAKDRNDVIGLLFTKDLIFIDPDDETPLQNFVQIFGRAVTMVWPDYALGEVLKLFKQGKSHLGLVRDVNNEGQGDPFYEVVGIITLEDIIEEILGDEIVDETDAFVDVETQLPVERREFDMSRLRLLNAQADTSALSSEEAKAVSSHLMTNVPQFKNLEQSHVEAIIADSPVVHVSREVSEGTAEPAPPEVLYRRGRTSTVCTFVLTGKVVVRAGKDGFQSDAGPWSVLAADALVEEEGSYKPDFSAHVGSEQLRCIRISKASFNAMAALSSTIDTDATDSTEMNAECDGSGSHLSVASSDKTGADNRFSITSGSDSGATGTKPSTLCRAANKGRAQGYFSPSGTRQSFTDAGKTSNASFKIRKAVTDAAVTLGEKSRTISSLDATDKVAEDGAEEKGAAEYDMDVSSGITSPVMSQGQGEETVPHFDYTKADSTEPDRGQIV